MSKLKSSYILTFLLLAMLSLSSCDIVLDDLIDGCNSFNYPVINTDLLRDGKVDEFYSDFVSAEVKNDPNDDRDYIYYFDVIGVLPEGVDWFVDNRRVYFEGTPTKAGLYRFTVEVWAEENQDWWNTNEFRELCDDYDAKGFTINIAE